ncbi:MAG: response regulator [Chloroflexi bacterium]|nr:response regulator [Chloroflexota bacterium]
MPAPPPFARQVRHALAHLYDPDVLRAHSLLGPFGLSDRANPQAALREALVGAVEALKPAPTVPVDSRTWRVYRVLTCRYVQQLDQEQTAHQLGVGVRHVRREQRVAVEALADLLYQQYGAPSAPPAGDGPHPLPAVPEPVPILGEGVTARRGDEVAGRLEDELAWLRAASQGETAVVAEALGAALHLVAPLATARDTRLETPPLPPLGPAAVHPAALRQAIVSAATCAIRRAPGGRVRFAAEQEDRQVRLRVSAVGQGALAAESSDAAASLAAARALLEIEGGGLACAEEAATFSLTLVVPAAEAVDVLLIDDNADFAQLFGRYVSGTRFRLHCQPNADRLFDVVAERRPRVVVLDVMIPGVDGWEILGRLRQHPLTGALPIVVCTILPERELALALGATGFLPKPVTRQALLTALDRALGAAPPAPR